jgi:hypothetical protein
MWVYIIGSTQDCTCTLTHSWGPKILDTSGSFFSKCANVYRNQILKFEASGSISSVSPRPSPSLSSRPVITRRRCVSRGGSHCRPTLQDYSRDYKYLPSITVGTYFFIDINNKSLNPLFASLLIQSDVGLTLRFGAFSQTVLHTIRYSCSVRYSPDPSEATLWTAHPVT